MAHINKPLQHSDLNLTTIRNIYKTEGFKKHKQHKDKPLPFESIDTGLYKKNAHCTCFITSEDRIHGWILALAESLYFNLGSSDNFNIVWEDEEPDNQPIQKTEFIVRDNTVESDEDFRYKVVVYITTGKIMIQGKSFKVWCENFFQKTLTRVNDLLKNVIREDEKVADNTCVKEIYKSTPHFSETDCNQNDLAITSEFQDESSKEKDVHSNGETQVNVKPVNPNSGKTTDDPSELSEKILKRLDVFEDAILKLTKQQCYTNEKLNNIEASVTIDRNKDETNKDLQRQLHKMNLQHEEVVSKLRLEIAGKENKIDKIQHELNSLGNKVTSDNVKDETIKELRGQINKISTEHETTVSNLRLEIQAKESKVNDMHTQLMKLQTKLEQMHKERDHIKAQADDLASKLECVDGVWIKKGSKSSRYVQTERDLCIEEGVTTSENVTIEEDDADDDLVIVEEIPSNIHQQNMNTNNVEEDPAGADVIVLHDSVCSKINPKRLSPHSTIEKIFCPSIQRASNTLETINTTKTIIIHVGINDLKFKPVEEVAKEMIGLVEKACSKANEVLLSLPIARKKGNYVMWQKVRYFSVMIRQRLNNRSKLILSFNMNIDDSLFRDYQHPNFNGTIVLARNIIAGLHPSQQRVEKNMFDEGARSYIHSVAQEKPDSYRHPSGITSNLNRRPNTHLNFDRQTHYGQDRSQPVSQNGGVKSTAESNKSKLAADLAGAILNILQDHQ